MSPSNKKVLEFFKGLTTNKSYIIKYEDLLINTADELRSIVSFLNLGFEPIMLDYYKHNQDKSLEPKELLSWKQKTLEKPEPRI